MVDNLHTFTFKLLQKIMMMMMMMITLSYPMKKQQMEMLMKPNRGKDVNRYSLCDVEYSRGTVEGRKILINSR